MSTKQNKRLSELYLEAAALESAEAMRAFLEQVGDESPDLARELEALLGQTVNESFLEAPAMHLDRADGDGEGQGQVIGSYRLLQKIGEGGMGVVYMAEQNEPVRRHVALKIIKKGMDTDQVIARFEAERQALAMMNHPNIARILDGGATEDGRPYFVMELVRGLPITEFCDETKRSTAQRLELFVQVCGAVHHAHQKGIIHRDLKPSNILVTVNDDQAVPKVIDFGIAKATHFRLTEKTLFTRLEQAIGTPNFMSPEQVGISSVDVDTRSDIYSLGALLYVLLTGENPFELGQTSWEEIRRLIREKDPSKPSTKLAGLDAASRSRAAERRRSLPMRLASELKGDLDWIVMKAMEKDRNRRYDTATELIADLKRHLKNEPVQARPPSVLYRFRKAWQRNRVAWSVAVLLTMALGIGLWNAWDAQRARQAEAEQRSRAQANERLAALESERAEEKEQLAKRRLYQADMNRVAEAFAAGKLEWIEPILVTHWPKPWEEEDYRGFEWYYWWRVAHRSQAAFRLPVAASKATRLALSPSREQALFATSYPEVFVRRVGDLLSPLHGIRHNAGPYPEYSPDGDWLIVEDIYSKGRFNVFDTTDWTVKHTVTDDAGGKNRHFSFSSDGSLLASGGDGNQIRIWQTATWEQRKRVYVTETSIRDLTLSRDGEQLIAAMEDGRLLVWQTADGDAMRTIPVHQAAVTTIVRSPDGTQFASADQHGGIHLWNAEFLPLSSDKLDRPINTLEFSSDGQQILAACGGLPSVQIWRIESEGRVLRRHVEFQGRSVPTVQAAFLGSNQDVLGLDEDGAVSVWTLAGERMVQKIPAVANRSGIRFTQDQGQTMLSMVQGREVQRWHVATESFVSPVTFTDRPIQILAADYSDVVGGIAADHSLGIWDAKTGRRLHRGPVLDGDATVLAASGTPPAVIYREERLKMRMWLPTPERNLEYRLSTRPNPVFLPGVDRVYAQQWIHDISGSESPGIQSVQDSSSYVPETMTTAASFSGNWFATGIAAGRIQVRDTKSWGVRHALRGHLGSITALAFSRDDSRLVSASNDQTIRFWDLQDGTLVASISTAPDTMEDLEFSQKGDALAALDSQGAVHIWAIPSESEVRQDSALWLSTAERERRGGNLDRAEEIYEAASLELGADADLLSALAAFHLEQAQWEKAVLRLSELFRLVSPGVTQYVQRAKALSRLGRGEEAMEDLLAALATRRERLPIRFFHDVRGVVDLSSVESADEDFETVVQRAQELRPNDAHLFAELGAHFQIDEGDFDPVRAAAFNLRAIELAPDQPRPWPPAGWMLLLAEDFDGYRDLCRRFVDQFADSTNEGIHAQIMDTCLLGASAAEDPLVRSLIEAYSGTEQTVSYNEPKVFRALAAYRIRELDLARKILVPILAQKKNTSERAQGMARAVMALVEHAEGNSEDAARWLGEADQMLPNNVSRTGTLLRWFLLVREARTTVRGAPPSIPGA